MNLTALFIGIAVAIFVIIHFKKTRLEGSKLAYAILLFTFPFYYLAFAIFGDDYTAIPFELLAGLLFFIIAALSVKLKHFYKFNLLAFGYILHGVYDITHNNLFINSGTPTWWPEFCGSVDILLGVYLMTVAFKYKAKNRETVS